MSELGQYSRFERKGEHWVGVNDSRSEPITPLQLYNHLRDRFGGVLPLEYSLENLESRRQPITL